jgi:hypothetical protein
VQDSLDRELETGGARAADAGRIVRRRAVYYIGGFDPRGPAWYYGTYKKACELQSTRLGAEIEISGRQRAGESLALWQVSATNNGVTTKTDYYFLRWDDIVRRYWPRGMVRMWLVTFHVLFRWTVSGVLRRVIANSWPTAICGTIPSGVIAALFLAGAIAGSLLGAIVVWLAGLPAWTIPLFALIVLIPVMIYGTRRYDAKYQINLLTRSYRFTMLQADRRTPDFDARMNEFADVLIDAARSGRFDEILLVGHSSGAHMAAMILARAFAKDAELGRHGAALSFLSLGHSINMLSWWPQAGWFREELQRVANEPSLTWVDFTFPQDGACFALFDPVAESGLTRPVDAEPKPKLLSLQLYKLFSPEEFAAIRREWYPLHFQYLSPTAKVGDYDFFAITAGAETLHDRFAHRQSVRGFDRFKLKFLAR